MKAKKFKSSAAQGDLYIKVVAEIPAGLKDAKKERGQYILAHSETGHHHVVDGNCVRVFHQDEFVSFVEVKSKCNIVHLRGFHTHAPIELKPGTKYRVNRQREYIPEGYRRAAD